MKETFSRRDLFASAAAAGAVAMVSGQFARAQTPLQSQTSAAGTLRERADRKGLLCGSAVSADTLANDARLRNVLQRDANVLVPENELKWTSLQPSNGAALNFAPAESIYAFATANTMKMRGHCLTWWQGEPEWAAAYIPTLSPGKAGDMLSQYVADVVGHWRGRLIQWDVVNEPISAKDEILEKLWFNALGEQYMDIAFKAAHAADPTTMLSLNQNLIEQESWWEEHQRDATLRLLERLLKRGVPIQLLGIESHLETINGFSETNWRRFLDEIAGFGLKIMITELDVHDRGTLGGIPERDAAVAALAGQYLDVTLSYKNCLGLLTWGEVDRYSWLRKMPDRQRTDGAALRPLARDDDYNPTRLWQAIATALDNAPHR